MSIAKPLVIVLSRNYSTGLGIIRSLGAAGYPIDLIASTKKKGSSVIASSSKYVRNTKEVLSTKIQGDSGENLIEALMEYAGKLDEKAVIFPTDDFTASVVDANRTLLKQYFLIPGTTEKAEHTILELMDKTVQGAFACQAGLLTPREWIVSLRDEICVPEDMIYPCFVKPLQSISGHKTEMKACTDGEDLKAHLEKMKSFFNDRSVLIQEFLCIEKEYDLSGVCLDQEIIIPSIVEKTGVAQYETGVAISGRILPIDTLGETIDKLKEMLKAFHYVGMFDIDLHFCNGKVYFSEVNFRSGGLSFSNYLNGVNLPEIYVKEITGEGHAKEEEVIKNFGRTFVYEKVAWEDYIYGYITKKQMIEIIETADDTLLANKEDPGPGKCFERRIRLSAIKQKTKRLLKRERKERADGDVVVIGRNYGNILTMTRDLGEAGYNVDVLRVYKSNPKPYQLLQRIKPDAYSKYVADYKVCVAGSNMERVVECLLSMKKRVSKPLLVPVDDYTSYLVDQYYDVLSQHYQVPNVGQKQGEISRLMDKFTQKKLAEAFGLPVLYSTLIQSSEGKFHIPVDIPYPCFVKPNVSMKSTKAMMKKCNTAEELQNFLQGYADKGDFEVLVEAFADIAAEYAVLGVSDGVTAAAPGVFTTTEAGHRERKGVAVMGQVVSHDKFGELIEMCRRFVESLQYTGIFDIDLLETKDGKLYFVELNFRAGASIRVFTKDDINLPAMFANRFLKNKAIDATCKMECAGRSFISEKVLLEEYVRSDADYSKVKACLDTADVHFIKDEKDPNPYQHFKKYFFVASLLRLPYKIRDYKRS